MIVYQATCFPIRGLRANSITGTYVRTTAIDRLIHGFLESEDKGARQIISLGAGSDTRFFRLKQQMPDVPLLYHELDFSSNAAAKIRQLLLPPIVQSVRSLCGIDLRESITSVSSVGGGEKDSLDWTAGKSAYHIHPVDLRSLRRTSEPAKLDEKRFSTWGISTDVPTLILSECCLIYLPPDDADSVLSYLTEAFSTTTPIAVVIYEPIRPNDAFGRTMVSNLTARGIHLQTLHAHDTLAAQRKRLRDHGIGEPAADGGAEAADVDFLWERWIEERERERVERLEWMDEVEEWKLLARHYAVAWGWRDCGSNVFRTWRNLAVQTEDE